MRTITGKLFTIVFNLAIFCTDRRQNTARTTKDFQGLRVVAVQCPFRLDMEFYFVPGFESAAGWAAGSRKEGLREAVKSYDFPRSVSPVTRSS